MRLLRGVVNIDENRFGFTSGRLTTDAIFIVRQIQERYLTKEKEKNKKKFYHVFGDLKKANNRIPRIVVEWALRRHGVTDDLLRVIMSKYKRLRTGGGCTESFEVKVGLHQGRVLSTLLIVLFLEDLMKEVEVVFPWEVLF